jgi:Carboxypeptidase regulatory-like domain
MATNQHYQEELTYRGAANSLPDKQARSKVYNVLYRMNRHPLFVSSMKAGLFPRIYVFIIFLGLFSVAGFSQSTSASVNGVLLDPSGAAIADALITARNTDTDLIQAARSSSSGVYSITPLPAGHYTITAKQLGFTTDTAIVTLTVNQAATVNFNMKMGQASQTVTVNAENTLINATTAEISNVVDHTAIEALPLNGRAPSRLLFLSPGVTNVLNVGGYNQTSNSFNTEAGGTGNGGQQGSTYALLDGVPNMDTYNLLMAPFPNPDATHAFRAITNNFGAQYGFSPSSIISIETNSGTNQIHGNVFEFIRNGALNAANWFSGAVDQLKQNQFGGSIGVPIIKDKVFVFANYQGTRQSLASGTNTAFTPTSAMLKGDFSALPETLRAPFSTVDGKPNQVNPALFSPAAVGIAESALPLGQTPSTGEVIFKGPTVDSSFNEGTLRLDYIMSPNLRFFARSFIQEFNYPGKNIPGNLLDAPLANAGKFHNEVISNTWLPSPSLVNVVSAAWVNMHVTSGNQLFTNTGKPFCLSSYINVADPPGCYVEGLSTGQWGIPFAEPNGDMRTTWWLSDNVTKTVGNHLLTAGLNFAHQFDNTTTYYPGPAGISFDGHVTGYSNADFLLGDVSSFYQGAFQNSPVRQLQFALYAQDQYKVRHNITLTAGLRWEPDWAATSINGGAGFVPGEQSRLYPTAPVGLIFPGDPGLNSNLRQSGNDYFEPRISIATQLRSRLVLRGGFGIFTAPLSYSFYNHVVGIAPIAPLYSFNATASSSISFQNPWAGFAATGGKSPFSTSSFEPTPNLPANQAIFLTPISVGASFGPNFRLPMTQSWTGSIEQQLTNTMVLHLAYVGSRSFHQTIIVDRNPGIYATGGDRTTYPEFSSITADESIGTASYNSLQVGLEKQLSHGLEFGSNFTWSKTLDLTSWGNPSFGGGLPNPFDIGFNYGISNLNVPLVSVSHWAYTTPGLNGKNVYLRTIAGAWEVSGIWTFQSGFPLTINGGDGNNNSESQQYGDRANYVPGQPYEVHRGSKANWLNQYFNRLAFVPNPPGTFGNTGKNILQGPGMNTADIALMKNWDFHEKNNIQFRWEMYNAFNHPNFGKPDTTPTDPNFGQITGLGPIAPRVMQAAIKVSF